MSFKGAEPEEDFDFSYKSVPPKRTIHMVMMSQEKAAQLQEVVEAARAFVHVQVMRQARQPDINAFRRLQRTLGALEGKEK